MNVPVSGRAVGAAVVALYVGVLLGRSATGRPSATAAESVSGVRLAAAEAKIADLADELEARTKRHGIEFGRLESGALAALEDEIRRGRAREEALTAELDSARTAAHDTDDQLALLQQRFEALQRSLAQRDARVAELNALLGARTQ